MWLFNHGPPPQSTALSFHPFPWLLCVRYLWRPHSGFSTKQQTRSIQPSCSLFGFFPPRLSPEWFSASTTTPPPHPIPHLCPKPSSGRWSLLIVSLQEGTEVKVISTFVEWGLQMSVRPNLQYLALCQYFHKSFCWVNVVISGTNGWKKKDHLSTA